VTLFMLEPGEKSVDAVHLGQSAVDTLN
jgi:hypothetical protein